ncbi:hypothetical protein [Amycolatopsis sp. H20-H5]|uniref:hypothetical protein n=1 Tax=Amycolatopsis sp. H20-H5 TaxID=3046309 RepID=UPI003FA36069
MPTMPPSLVPVTVSKTSRPTLAHNARFAIRSNPPVARHRRPTSPTGTVSSSTKIANSANRVRSVCVDKPVLASIVAATACRRWWGSLMSSGCPASPVN